MGFEGIGTVLLDLDGTLYEGTRVVPGAPEAVRRLRDAGLTLRFTTNTDSVSPSTLAGRLRDRGFDVSQDELVTPVAVAVTLFGSIEGARVLAVAAEGVRALLGDVLAGPGETPTHVLAADPSYGVTYGELDAAFRALRAGAELVATQVNRVARRDDGEHVDTGGVVRLLEYAAEVEARVLGKPSADFLATPLRALGAEPASALVAGDDVDADLAAARAVGAKAVLVRTGKGAGAGDDHDADAVAASVAELPDLLGI